MGSCNNGDFAMDLKAKYVSVEDSAVKDSGGKWRTVEDSGGQGRTVKVKGSCPGQLTCAGRCWATEFEPRSRHSCGRRPSAGEGGGPPGV